MYFSALLLFCVVTSLKECVSQVPLILSETFSYQTAEYSVHVVIIYQYVQKVRHKDILNSLKRHMIIAFVLGKIVDFWRENTKSSVSRFRRKNSILVLMSTSIRSMTLYLSWWVLKCQHASAPVHSRSIVGRFGITELTVQAMSYSWRHCGWINRRRRPSGCSLPDINSCSPPAARLDLHCWRHCVFVLVVCLQSASQFSSSEASSSVSKAKKQDRNSAQSTIPPCHTFSCWFWLPIESLIVYVLHQE